MGDFFYHRRCNDFGILCENLEVAYEKSHSLERRHKINSLASLGWELKEGLLHISPSSSCALSCAIPGPREPGLGHYGRTRKKEALQDSCPQKIPVASTLAMRPAKFSVVETAMHLLPEELGVQSVAAASC